MKVFITGGTGFVGEHVVRELVAAGHQARLLVHTSKPGTAGAFEQVEGDVTRLESFEQAVEGCDAVIHLVGIIREFPRRNITFERLHVQATANAVAAAKNAGVCRYLHMSALGVRAGAVSGYHRTKYQAEELVRSSGLETTIFRPSLIYGPRDSFINMLAAHLRLAPVMPVIGSGDYRLQPIHAGDVARCFAMALAMPETIGRSYELCGDQRMTYVELIDQIAVAMGRAKPFKPTLPLGLMKIVIPAMQSLPQFPITMDQLQMLLEESICDGCWKNTFNLEPRCFSDGIRDYLGQ